MTALLAVVKLEIQAYSITKPRPLLKRKPAIAYSLREKNKMKITVKKGVEEGESALEEVITKLFFPVIRHSAFSGVMLFLISFFSF